MRSPSSFNGDWGNPERLASVVMARQVPPDHVTGHRKESLVATAGAPDPWLFPDPSDPFITAGGRVPGLARFPALEATRENIFAPTKEGAEQSNLGLRCGLQANNS